MKIAYITENIDVVGGIERGLCRRANYMVEHLGWEVTIYCTNKNNGQIFYYLNPKVKIVYLTNLSYDISFVERILLQAKQAKMVLSEQPDVIISLKFTIHNLFFQLFKKKQKLISELREPKKLYDKDKSSFRSKIYASFRNLILRKQDVIITLTQSDKKEWGFKNIEVINNFKMIETDVFSKLDQQQVLSVGRLDKIKGYNYLINAWFLVNKRFPNWKLKICGEGIEFLSLKEQICNLGLENSIILANQSVDVRPEYLSSSIFVLTSIYEAFGNVIVEAQTFGLPVICFDAPHGPSEIINDEIDGFLVPLFDVNYLSDRIIKLIENEKMREEMGRNAKLNSERFDFDVIIKKYLEIIINK